MVTQALLEAAMILYRSHCSASIYDQIVFIHFSRVDDKYAGMAAFEASSLADSSSSQMKQLDMSQSTRYSCASRKLAADMSRDQDEIFVGSVTEDARGTSERRL